MVTKLHAQVTASLRHTLSENPIWRGPYSLEALTSLPYTCDLCGDQRSLSGMADGQINVLVGSAY
jgi:hypothetical protein